MFWGLSEAQDLVEKYRKYNKNQNRMGNELNILLFGSGDIRHILQTLANQRIASAEGHPPVHWNFYLIDGSVDVVARNLLLIDIILSRDSSVSLLGRTHLFMDIYGNTFIRPASRDYQRKRGNLFLNAFSDYEEIPEKYSPLIDLSALKYKDRDQLQDVFSVWRSEESVELQSQWNGQLRNYLGHRFDSRRGAFDWDLHMELRYRGGQRICNQEYLDFRESGIAFQFPEFEYSFENKSLVVTQRDKNHRKSFHLMTDMHTGPYPAFGLHCEDDEMNKSDHGTNFYRSTDITERNLLKIFYNIRKQENPTNDQLRKHKLGAAKFTPGNILTADEEDLEQDTVDDGKLIDLDNIKLHLLSPEMVKKLSEQKKFENYFDVAFIGAGCFQYMNKEFVNCIKSKGILLFETLQLSLLHKDKRAAFEEQVKQFGMDNCLELMTNFNLNKHYTTYDYKRSSGKGGSDADGIP